ncbi:hypothetical protein IWQ61_007605 [Dispira simplex]|nr:hypothetical protein IWQ61_007605 [Dispira simplex]
MFVESSKVAKFHSVEYLSGWERQTVEQSNYLLTSLLSDHSELLPPRYDWLGQAHTQSYTELVSQFPSVHSSHLLNLLLSITTSPNSVLNEPSIPQPGPSPYARPTTLLGQPTVTPITSSRCSWTMQLARSRWSQKPISQEWPLPVLGQYEELVRFHGHKYPTYCITFDGTGLRLITGSDDYLVKIWCARSGYLINTLRGHREVITDMAVNLENTLLATASMDGILRVWDLKSGAPRVILMGHRTGSRKAISSVLFSPAPIPEIRYLLATGEDGKTRLWHWSRTHSTFSGEPFVLDCRTHPRDSIRCSVFNSTGSHFAISGTDGVIRVFSTVSGLTPDQVDLPRRKQFYSMQASSVDKQRLSGYSDGVTVPADPLGARHDMPPPKLVAQLEGHSSGVTALLYSRDGTQLMSSSLDGTARVWKFDPKTRQWSSLAFEMDTLIPNDQAASDIVPNRDQSQAPGLTGHPTDVPMSQTTTQPEDPGTTGQPLNNSEPISSTSPTGATKPAPITMSIWSLQDEFVIIASSMGTVKVFDSHTGQLHTNLVGHTAEVYVIASHPFSPQLVLTAGYDGRIILWNIETGDKFTEFHYPDRQFLDGRFSPDGYQFVVSDDQGACRLFGLGCNINNYYPARQFKEQMFITDYMPVVLDTDLNVIDQQTQVAPHLLQRPPISDFDGREYAAQKPPNYGNDFPTSLPAGMFEKQELARLEELRRELTTLGEETLVTSIVPGKAARKQRRTRQPATSRAPEEEDPLAIEAPIYPLPDDEDDGEYQGTSSSAESAVEEEEPDYNAHDTYPGVYSYLDDEAMEDNTFSLSDEDNEDEYQERGYSGRHRSSRGRRRTTSTNRQRNRTRRQDTYGGGRISARQTSQRSIMRYVVPDEESDGLPGSSPGHSDSDELLEGYLSRTRSQRSTRRTNQSTVSIQSNSSASHFSSEDNDGEVSYSQSGRLRRRRVERSYLESSDSDSAFLDFIEAQSTKPSTSNQAGTSINGHAGPSITTETGSDSIAQKRRGKRPLVALYTTSEEDENQETLAASDDDDSDIHSEGRVGSAGESDSSPENTSASMPRRSQNGQGKQPAFIEITSDEADQSSPTGSSIVDGVRGLSTASNESGRSAIPAAFPNPESTGLIYPSVIPYRPQMDDLIVYFPEGHQQFLAESTLKDHFKSQHYPWKVFPFLGHTVFGVVKDIKYQVGPPTLCTLTIQQVILPVDTLQGKMTESVTNDENPSSYTAPSFALTKHRLKIEYHDTTSCPDFVILFSLYQYSLRQQLRLNEQVIVVFNDEEKYQARIIDEKEENGHDQPLESPVPDLWQRYKVEWDPPTQSPEWLSPWEMVKESHTPPSATMELLGSVQEEACLQTLKELMGNRKFSVFVPPVDMAMYATYPSVVAYPMCLETIQLRLRNHFYRHMEAVEFDIKLIRENANRFNEPHSFICTTAQKLPTVFHNTLKDRLAALRTNHSNGSSISSRGSNSLRSRFDHHYDSDTYAESPIGSEVEEEIDEEEGNDKDLLDPSEEESLFGDSGLTTELTEEYATRTRVHSSRRRTRSTFNTSQDQHEYLMDDPTAPAVNVFDDDGFVVEDDEETATRRSLRRRRTKVNAPKKPSQRQRRNLRTAAGPSSSRGSTRSIASGSKPVTSSGGMESGSPPRSKRRRVMSSRPIKSLEFESDDSELASDSNTSDDNDDDDDDFYEE